MIHLVLVTVLYRCADQLPDFFQSLALQRDQAFDLYVVDNSDDASDESFDTATREAARAGLSNRTHLFKNANNVGVAAGNNQGIRWGLERGASHVLLLNNDIEFASPTLLKDIVAAATKRDAPMVSPRIYHFDDRTLWYAGGDIVESRGTTVHFGAGLRDDALSETERFVGYAPTCFMLIAREVFDQIGVMDEKYFVYYDDTDFVLRARRSGFKILYWPAGVVLHKVSSSTGGNLSPFTTRFANRNRLYFIRKNFRGWARFRALAFYLLTRPTRREFWSAELRPTLLRAIREGFSLSVAHVDGR